MMCSSAPAIPSEDTTTQLSLFLNMTSQRMHNGDTKVCMQESPAMISCSQVGVHVCVPAESVSSHSVWWQYMGVTVPDEMSMQCVCCTTHTHTHTHTHLIAKCSCALVCSVVGLGHVDCWSSRKTSSGNHALSIVYITCEYSSS